MGSRNVEVSKILKTWWKGQRSKEPSVDGEEGEEGRMTRNSCSFKKSGVKVELGLQFLVSSAVEDES